MSKVSAIFSWARLLAPIILANIPKTAGIASQVAAGMDEAQAIHDATGPEKLQHVIALGHAAAGAVNDARPGTVNTDALDVAIAGGVNAAFAAATVIADAHGHPAQDDTLASQLAHSGYSTAPGTENLPPGLPGPVGALPQPDATAVSSDEGTVNQAVTLRVDGPTFEAYVAAGYLPATYPPQGYAEVPSAGLDAYRADQAAHAQATDEGMGEGTNTLPDAD